VAHVSLFHFLEVPSAVLFFYDLPALPCMDAGLHNAVVVRYSLVRTMLGPHFPSTFARNENVVLISKERSV